MKKLIAVLLAIVMMFSMSTVCVFAADADDTTSDGILDFEHGDTGNDDEIEETYYSLLNFFADLLERINLLFEYIMTVFFPSAE